MTPIRVARIPYLNSEPFYQGQGEAAGGIDYVDMPPRQLGQAALRDEVDAGLMSMADAFRNPQFEPLAGLGIAVKGPAHSVLLFSQRPPEELEGARIGVTEETSTSYALLRLLLEQRYGVSSVELIRRAAAGHHDAAILLIGDAALRLAARAGVEPGRSDYGDALLSPAGVDETELSYRYILDLGAAWRQWQDLPFVFAQWMVRRSMLPDDRRRLLSVLEASLASSERRLQSLAAEHCGAVGLSAEGAHAYLSGFNYRFGAAEREAVRRFRRLLDTATWWQAAPPLAVQARDVEAVER